MVYLWIGLGLITFALLAWAFVYVNNNALQVTRYEKRLGIEKDVKIVHLSDIHGKSFGRKNEKLLKKIASEKPDVIAVTGDIIHKYRERDIGVALELVSSMCAIAPVLFVSGNHEMRNKGYRAFRKQLMEAGAVVMDDCNKEIAGLTVTGLNCASLKNGTAERLKPDSAEKAVLLAHKPHFFENYAKAGYGLVLCGHAHGGQWRIPFTGVGIFSPGQGMFPKLTSGRHTLGDTEMIISRGLGNSQCPLRLFNRPEIVVITIK